MPMSDWFTRLKSHKATPTAWEAQRREEAAQLLSNAEESGDWIMLATHCNGFVREVAVRELRDRLSPEALVALIDRLNDWVPQIRDLARECVKNYLSPSHVQALLFAFKSFMALASRHRTDHGPILMAVREVLQAPEIHEEVYASFQRRQGKEARYLFTLLLESAVDTQKLLGDALAHQELTVRLMAVAATHMLPHAQAIPLLREAILRPSSMVRVCVLRALLPMLENPRTVLQAALFDSSPSIRSLARWEAPKHNIDARGLVAERQLSVLPTAKQEWLGLLGLAAELGIELEETWLRAATQSSFPAVRRFAMGLLSTAQLPELFSALDDSSDKVFCAAVAQLGKQPWPSLCAELNARLDRDWHELSTTRLRALMHLRPQWQQVDYLLVRLAKEPVAQAYWALQIKLWCDEQYQVVDPVTPKAERKELIEKLKHLAFTGLISSESVERIC